MADVAEKIVFRFLEGAKKGDVASFAQKNIVLGRASDCDLVFDSRDDRTVSGHHAVVRYRDLSFELSDSHSTNGTFVNGKRSENATLRSGDVIRLGALGPEIEVVIASGSSDHTILESDQLDLASMAADRGSEPTLIDADVSEKILRLRHRRFIRNTMVVAVGSAAGISGFVWTLIEGFEMTPAGQYFRAALSLIAGGVVATLIFTIYHGRPGHQRFKLIEALWMLLIILLSLAGAFLSLNPV